MTFSDKMLVVHPNGFSELIDLPKDEAGQYEAITGQVGGWLEGLSLTADLRMYFDEEGIRKFLPFNREATSIVIACSPHTRMGGGIPGTVVIVGSDGGPNECGVPERLIPLLEDTDWASLAIVNYLAG